MSTIRRVRFAGLAIAAAATLAPAVALAHPLGNFTINHYSGVRVAPDAIVVDHVLDFAEIPTFAAFRAVDTDGDGVASDGERAAAAGAHCAEQAGALTLTVDGAPLALAVTGSAVSFPMGQGAPTMRVVCRLDAAVPAGVVGSVAFADQTYAERAGWREMVVQGDGLTVAGDVPTVGLSERLTSYPTGLLEQPVEVSAVTFTVTPGGPTLAALAQPELSSDGGAAGEREATGATDVPGSTEVTGVPGGSAELTDELAGLFQAQELTLPVVLVSLLAAAALGALHALSPGHGKTVMAAYLVGSRGTMRQALGLGTTVTVSHTLGVLALGALSLSASAIIPPERLYPFLGIVSGAIVILIAGWLLLGIARGGRTRRAAAAEHAQAHATGADHEHAHAHGDAAHVEAHEAHDHPHPHPHDHGSDHAPVGQAENDGYHTHGGIRHTHVLPAGQPLRWRALFALGLAGGMVPSVSAIILLLGSIAAGRPAYGIALTIAFGLGMAVVLVGIGVALVYARGLIDRLPARSPGRTLGRLIPAGSATVMLVAGLLIMTQAALTLP